MYEERGVYLPFEALSSTLGLPRAYLKKLIKESRLPFLDTGNNRLRFNPQAVQSVLDEMAAQDTKLSKGRLLPASAMARKLSVPIKWLKQQAEEDKLPAVKADTTFLFNDNVIEKILLQRAQEGNNAN